jgi:hypothetical protein
MIFEKMQSAKRQVQPKNNANNARRKTQLRSALIADASNTKYFNIKERFFLL